MENKTYKITDQGIDDIIVTALEGGINYWCMKAVPINKDGDLEYLGEYASDQISRGGSLVLYDNESDDTWVLDKEKFMKGLDIFIRKCGEDNHTHNNYIDAGTIDSTLADCIVQFALFDDLVFG